MEAFLKEARFQFVSEEITWQGEGISVWGDSMRKGTEGDA